jgi:uncharacterized protein (TIGR02266 family)
VERYYPNGKLGGLSLDGRPPGPLGSRVALVVRVRKREFTVHGQIAWVRHQTTRQPAAFGVDFLPEDDASRVRLLAFARDEVTPDAVRGSKRMQLELPVRLVHEGNERREFLADLSSGGAFVRTWNPLPVGELVELSVRSPSTFFATAVSVKGYVVWARAEGEHPGMGIEFVPDAPTVEKLERLMQKLAREG